jgi:hypothetical protein
MDAWPEEMKAEQERMEANNQKFQILQGTLISWMDIHQIRTDAIQEKNGHQPKGNNTLSRTPERRN